MDVISFWTDASHIVGHVRGPPARMVVENRAFRKDKLAKQPVVDVARRRG
jgi:hypothetical protein